MSQQAGNVQLQQRATASSSLQAPPFPAPALVETAATAAATAGVGSWASMPPVPTSPERWPQQWSNSVEPTRPRSPELSAAHSAARDCCIDALHCVFAFLPLNQLLAAAWSCRAWWAAACREVPRELTLDTGGAAVYRAAHGSMRRHVATISLQHEAITPLQLRLLHVVPNLRAVSCRLTQSGLGASWPGWRECLQPLAPSLRKLDLRCRGDIVVQELLNALPSVTALAELQLSLVEVGDVDWAPLLNLRQLRAISLSASDTVELHRNSCTVLKNMPQLRRIDGSQWKLEQLQLFCSRPHQLDLLEEVELDYSPVSDAHMACLLHLPGLTRLTPLCLQLTDYSQLAGFPRMHELCLSDLCAPPGLEEQLCSAFTRMHELRTLFIRIDDNDAADELRDVNWEVVAGALPRLLQLTLELRRDKAIHSLAFLRHMPLLETLSLRATSMPLADLLRLQLPKLRHLTIWGIVDPAECAQLRPPSALFPALQAFNR